MMATWIDSEWPLLLVRVCRNVPFVRGNIILIFGESTSETFFDWSIIKMLPPPLALYVNSFAFIAI